MDGLLGKFQKVYSLSFWREADAEGGPISGS